MHHHVEAVDDLVSIISRSSPRHRNPGPYIEVVGWIPTCVLPHWYSQTRTIFWVTVQRSICVRISELPVGLWPTCVLPGPSLKPNHHEAGHLQPETMRTDALGSVDAGSWNAARISVQGGRGDLLMS